MLIMIWILPIVPHCVWGFKYLNLNSFPRLLWGCRRLSCVPGVCLQVITLRQLTAGSHRESGLVGCQRPYKYSGAQSTSLWSYSLFSPLLLVPLKFVLPSSLLLVCFSLFLLLSALYTWKGTPAPSSLVWKAEGRLFFFPFEILFLPFWKISLLNESLKSAVISSEKLVRNKPVQRLKLLFH